MNDRVKNVIIIVLLVIVCCLISGGSVYIYMLKNEGNKIVFDNKVTQDEKPLVDQNDKKEEKIDSNLSSEEIQKYKDYLDTLNNEEYLFEFSVLDRNAFADEPVYITRELSSTEVEKLLIYLKGTYPKDNYNEIAGWMSCDYIKIYERSGKNDSFAFIVPYGDSFLFVNKDNENRFAYLFNEGGAIWNYVK